MIVLDLALMLAGLYLFWCALIFAVGFVVVMSAVLHDWLGDRRDLRQRLREDAEVQALELIPTPGPWDMEVTW